MLRKRFPAKVCLLFLALYLTSSGNLAEAEEKPSILMLFRSPSNVSDSESMKLVDIVYEVFADSGALSPIDVEPKQIFWTSIQQAASFSLDKWADYMVYMGLSKNGIQYSYDAKLVKPKGIFIVDTYNDSWPDVPQENKKAMFKLASKLFFASTNKVTVYITIESSPNYCDVYKNEHRIGHTDKDKGFRKNLVWDKGEYNIKVSKPGYNEKIEKLVVKRNPTDFHRNIILKRK